MLDIQMSSFTNLPHTVVETCVLLSVIEAECTLHYSIFNRVLLAQDITHCFCSFLPILHDLSNINLLGL